MLIFCEIGAVALLSLAYWILPSERAGCLNHEQHNDLMLENSLYQRLTVLKTRQFTGLPVN
ncbi:hypothetical protein KSX_56890 [Ktedonospora formicarum]|uniref:Uncharacterized protein n=1 Tax=Ktedonospora formicarum TaxID=2778364 RepID=A0A8J3I2F0_9CHLR|nr:hypothetical protein KSX_56890 [Ktedonospora formicarum]